MRRYLGYSNERAASSWPINNRPQVNNLPHIEVLAPIGGECFSLPSGGGQAKAFPTSDEAFKHTRRTKYTLKIARQFSGLLVTALIGGFLTAALVRHSPGFDADERD